MFVIGIMAASILPASGGTVLVCDVHDASPPNELLRVIVESFPDQTVFLPSDDPVFTSAGVLLNIEGIIHNCAPAEHYDAVLQYPLGPRLPLP